MAGTVKEAARTTSLRFGEARLTVGGVTHVMGVINLSPESKNLHTVADTPQAALDMARRYRQRGVAIIDVGGQSSHPDNPTISVAEELDRLLPVVSALAAERFIVSVDTWKPDVARACLEAGAGMINDTGGLKDPAMRAVVAASGTPGLLMYVEGSNPHDVGEVIVSDSKASITAEWMADRLAALAGAGIGDVIVDPGIAINYRGDYSEYTRMQLQVIRSLETVRALGRPVLVPIPRKQEDHRVAAYIAMALEHEADLIRVHDVEMACDLVELFDRAG